MKKEEEEEEKTPTSAPSDNKLVGLIVDDNSSVDEAIHKEEDL